VDLFFPETLLRTWVLGGPSLLVASGLIREHLFLFPDVCVPVLLHFRGFLATIFPSRHLYINGLHLGRVILLGSFMLTSPDLFPLSRSCREYFVPAVQPALLFPWSC